MRRVRTERRDATMVFMAKSKAQSKDNPASSPRSGHFTQALKVGKGSVLAECDPRSTPGHDGGKAGGADLLAATVSELEELQERLYAGSTRGPARALLLVIQGMDTSGKGGIMRHVIGSVDPQGVRLTAFKAPTKDELDHPFLWRIRNALP